MRRTALALNGLLATACAALLPAAASAEVTATRTLEETVTPAGSGPPLVIVKNVFGSVRVTAHDRATVEMTATETITGDLQADIDRARAEMALRTESEPGRVAFRVRRNDGDCECNRWNDGYVVRYDIEVRVPRHASVDLSTVNDGDVIVENVRGALEVSNVNGGVELHDVRGGGSVKTVNGTIEATFAQHPGAELAFKTVNGLIDVAFPADLSADLRLKTMNGDLYTDFDATPVATQPAERTRAGRGLVMRMERSPTLRVGAGGLVHSFETLNGDVYIRKGAR